MNRKTVLSGQVYGTIDIAGYEDGTLVSFIHEHVDRSRQVRCVIRGAVVQQWLQLNPGVQDRSRTVTAYGRISARCSMVKGELQAELVVDATFIEVEAHPQHRVSGAVMANLKGIVHHWQPEKSNVLRTYINSTVAGDVPRVDCLLNMAPILEASKVGAHLAQGREYTVMVTVELGHYTLNTARGPQHVPVIRMTPKTFRLQA